MKKILLLIYLAATCLFVQAQDEKKITGPVTATVFRIYDGDTFTAKTDNGLTFRVRLDGIDAPERTQDLGMYSRAYLVGLIGDDMKVRVNPVEIDYYGRLVAQVINYQNKDISAEMLIAGMAWFYEEYSDDPTYRMLEERARKEGVGVHANPFAIKPRHFRQLRKVQRIKYEH